MQFLTQMGSPSPPMFSLFPQFAEVKDDGLLRSAVFSPLSSSTALLTVLQPAVTQHDHLLRTEINAPTTAEAPPDLPAVVNSVLGVIYDIMNNDDDGINGRNSSKAGIGMSVHIDAYIC